MRILLCTPAPPGSRTGNRITALRWAQLLRAMGHEVAITTGKVPRCELLVALHAVRSADAVTEAFARARAPRIAVVLTGTDYQPRLSRTALETLAHAGRIVVLNRAARATLPPGLARRAQVIIQSATAERPWSPRGTATAFRVVVAGHLRAVKDPLRAARAVRTLPGSSRMLVLHAGGALEPALASAARAEMRTNPRYRWLGELSARRARQLIASASVFVLSSRAEGGASALSEAIAARVPIVASAIPNAIDLLGPQHPGLFTAGETSALRSLLLRAEGDPVFAERLRPRVRAVERVSPEAERRALQQLVTWAGSAR